MYEKEINLAMHITDELNGSFNKQAFCDRMSREHRTLQAEFTELCLDWFKMLSDMYKEDNYDGRNLYSCQTGNSIMRYLEDCCKNYRVDVFYTDAQDQVTTNYYSTLWQAREFAFDTKRCDNVKNIFILHYVIDGKYDVMEVM